MAPVGDNGWKIFCFGDLFRIKHGYAFKGEYFSDSGPYVVLTPGNFYEEGGFKHKGDKEKYYTGEFPRGFLLSHGDLIVAMTEQSEGLLGSPVLVPESDRYLHNQRLGLIVDLNETEIYKKFLYYLFNYRDIRDQIRATASGAKVRHTSPSRIYEAEVKLPPLPTQRKIAAVLSAYDDLIENNTRRIEILEEMARAIYREWFVRFRFPGHEKVELVDSVLGPIPEGWEREPFSRLADLSRAGLNPSKFEDETFFHFSIPAFDDGYMPKLECGWSIKSNKFLIPDGCVLLSKINPRIPRVWLPMIERAFRSITSTEFLVLVPKPPITADYLYSLCRSDEFLGDFAGLALGTSTSHQRVKSEALFGMTVLIPPPSLIEKYSGLASPMLTAAHKLRLKNVNIRRTRDLLLPKLISGEVDVENIDVGDELGGF